MCGLRRLWAGNGLGDRERDGWGWVRGGGREVVGGGGGVAPTHVIKRLSHAFDHPCFVGGDADDGTYAAAGDCGYGFMHLAV